MLKQIICIAAITTMITGCVSTPPHARTIPVDAASLDSSLEQHRGKVVNAIEACQAQHSTGINTLSEQLTQLDAKVSALSKQQTVKAQPEVTPIQCPPSVLKGKFLLGAIENVFINELNTSFNTRIDTGAESSSLDAHNIVLFERDGDQWVRFDVFTHGPEQASQTFESKVERFVRIKESQDKSDRRPVIHAHLEIGQYTAETDLNLTDRSHLEFPLLLGRKFMQDIAVVDVGQTFVHGKNKSTQSSSAANK